MRIGGFQKQSFIDWDGKLTAVVFTKGCNFRCSFCHNPNLVYPELIQAHQDISTESVMEYLYARKNWLDGVVITGGEPTLQKDLKAFIQEIKSIGYLVKLDTNGAQPSILQNLIDEDLIDFVAMDVKTILEEQAYQHICGIKDRNLLDKIKQSIQILKDASIPYQLRTTIVPEFHTQSISDDLEQQFSYCNYRLQEYRPPEAYL